MKVYAVTAGDRSFTSVVAVYTDEAKAKALAEALKEGFYDEFILDGLDFPIGKKLFIVGHDFTWNIKEGKQTPILDKFYCYQTDRVDEPKAIWAKNEEEAIRIFKERNPV